MQGVFVWFVFLGVFSHGAECFLFLFFVCLRVFSHGLWVSVRREPGGGVIGGDPAYAYATISVRCLTKCVAIVVSTNSSLGGLWTSSTDVSPEVLIACARLWESSVASPFLWQGGGESVSQPSSIAGRRIL